MQGCATEVDFKTIVNDYLSNGNPHLLIHGCFLLVKLWDDYDPIRSRKATGELETGFPVYPHPERLFTISQDSVKALLRAVTNPKVYVGLKQGKTVTFEALTLIAYHQPVHRSFIIDYLLQHTLYTEYDRSESLTILLVDLYALGYRGVAIIDKIRELLIDVGVTSPFLVEAIACTYDDELIGLLKLWEPADISLHSDFTLRTAVEARLAGFTDEYHGLPELTPFLSRLFVRRPLDQAN